VFSCQVAFFLVGCYPLRVCSIGEISLFSLTLLVTLQGQRSAPDFNGRPGLPSIWTYCQFSFYNLETDGTPPPTSPKEYHTLHYAGVHSVRFQHLAMFLHTLDLDESSPEAGRPWGRSPYQSNLSSPSDSGFQTSSDEPELDYTMASEKSL